MTSSLLTADEKSWGEWGVLGISAVPVCIANLDSWIQKYSDGVLGIKRSVDESLNLPVTIFRLGMDQGEVPEYRLMNSAAVTATLHFDPYELYHHRMGNFEILIKRQIAPSQGDDEILFTGLLKECPVGPSTH
jgi:hypothetical protein